MRNLAQRSAEAAKNTATLIEESQENAVSGVAVSSEVAEILKNIYDATQKVTQLNSEVSSASDEQAKGIEQVNKAVSEMDKVTQSNAANAEESASASEELSAQANELQDQMNVLRSIVEGINIERKTVQHSAPPATKRNSVSPLIRKQRQLTPAHQEHDWAQPETVKNSPRRGMPNRLRRAEMVIPMTADEIEQDF